MVWMMAPGGFRSITCLDFRMRVLVIGAGPTTMHEHLPVLARLRDAGTIVLAIICDIDRARASAARRKFGFLEESGDGLAALRRADIDAVYIFGSAQLHFEYGMLALKNAKHLFVEKPIAPGFAQAAALADTAANRGLIAVGGLNRRFFKSLDLVRERAGKSSWRFAESVFHKSEFGRAPAFGARTWLTANGIHALDALLWMMGGLPEHMTSLTDEPVAGAAPSAFTAVMRWHDGAQGTFLCNNIAGARREEYVFHGVGETYRVNGDGLTVEKDGATTHISLPLIGDGFAAEHAAFVEAVRTGEVPRHSLGAIAPSLYLAELMESGFSGRVEMPEFASPPVSPAIEVSEKSILVVHSAELQPGLARLLPQYRLVTLEDIRDSERSRPDVVAAILGRGSAPLPLDILDKVPKLSVVGVMALSLARHEPQALIQRGIAVLNASAAYADSVAEFALGVAILARRRAFASHTILRRGGWGTDLGPAGFTGLLFRAARRARPALKAAGVEPVALKLWRKTAAANSRASSAPATMARDLKGAVVGLLGWGENARVFAQSLKRHQARVLVYSEHARAEDIREVGAIPATLAEVLSSDVVSLHRGLTSRTRHFLGGPELSKLRAGAVLINTARGALIEPDALLARLKRGDIFACLDTFDEEPLPASHALRDLPNVFLTSHIAGGSRDMHAAAADEVIRKVAAYLSGQPMNSISAQRLSTMT
jgi:phosphoglycerate dehydrogenase-like enzyme/predicted dehydrogenase